MKELLREKKKIISRVNIVNARILDHTSACECKDCSTSIQLAREITDINSRIRAAKAEKPVKRIPSMVKKQLKKCDATVENYNALAKEGYLELEIAKSFSMSKNRYYEWKKEVGLLKTKKKQPVNVMAKQEKDATQELLAQIKKMQNEIEPVYQENQKLKEEVEESIQKIKNLEHQLKIANRAKQLLLESDVSEIMVKYIHSLDLLEESAEAMVVLRNLNSIKAVREHEDVSYAN